MQGRRYMLLDKLNKILYKEQEPAEEVSIQSPVLQEYTEKPISKKKTEEVDIDTILEW